MSLAEKGKISRRGAGVMVEPTRTLQKLVDSCEGWDDEVAYDAVAEVTCGDLRSALEAFAALHQEIERLRGEPNLGLATTQQLLDELTVRIEVDYYSGGGGLDYTTFHGRPEESGHG